MRLAAGSTGKKVTSRLRPKGAFQESVGSVSREALPAPALLPPPFQGPTEPACRSASSRRLPLWARRPQGKLPQPALTRGRAGSLLPEPKGPLGPLSPTGRSSALRNTPATFKALANSQPELTAGPGRCPLIHAAHTQVIHPPASIKVTGTVGGTTAEKRHCEGAQSRHCHDIKALSPEQRVITPMRWLGNSV